MERDGFVYQITCNITGKKYIGSTIQDINERIWAHKKNLRRWNDGIEGYCSSYEIIEMGDFKVDILETVKCVNGDKTDLLFRERFHIENNDCINEKKNPISTDEEKIEQRRKYREENNTEINIRNL